jgi:hypothetical protein
MLLCGTSTHLVRYTSCLLVLRLLILNTVSRSATRHWLSTLSSVLLIWNDIWIFVYLVSSVWSLQVDHIRTFAHNSVWTDVSLVLGIRIQIWFNLHVWFAHLPYYLSLVVWHYSSTSWSILALFWKFFVARVMVKRLLLARALVGSLTRRIVPILSFVSVRVSHRVRLVLWSSRSVWLVVRGAVRSWFLRWVSNTFVVTWVRVIHG